MCPNQDCENCNLYDTIYDRCTNGDLSPEEDPSYNPCPSNESSFFDNIIGGGVKEKECRDE